MPIDDYVERVGFRARAGALVRAFLKCGCLLLFCCGWCLAQQAAAQSPAALNLPELTQFSPLYRKAVEVYFSAAAAYRQQNYAGAQKQLRALWAEVPHGDPAWKQLQRESTQALSVADFGTPAAYSALRMLTDAVEWRLNSGSAAAPVSTVQLAVVLVGKSTGPEPATFAELDRREGRVTTNALDAALDGAQGEQIINDSYWLFDEYVLAITGGRTRVKRVFVRLPEVTLQVGMRRHAVEVTREAGEQVWAAVPAHILRSTDWWHLVYPSHLPKSAVFANEQFVTGGMRRGHQFLGARAARRVLDARGKGDGQGECARGGDGLTRAVHQSALPVRGCRPFEC